MSWDITKNVTAAVGWHRPKPKGEFELLPRPTFADLGHTQHHNVRRHGACDVDLEPVRASGWEERGAGGVEARDCQCYDRKGKGD
eukprot:9819572-Alexandrium_andersonii.AAC.1